MDRHLQEHLMIELKTSLGPIILELDFDRAPVSAKNFQDYVERGFL